MIDFVSITQPVRLNEFHNSLTALKYIQSNSHEYIFKYLLYCTFSMTKLSITNTSRYIAETHHAGLHYYKQVACFNQIVQSFYTILEMELN